MDVHVAAIASRVRMRLALPCVLFMFMSSLDRANVSFAAAAMNSDLGLSPAQYGFGASILFVGFLAGQYPSVWWLQRVGMRRWLAACALIWGLAAAAMAFITGTTGFFVLRIVLGLAEAGVGPGIVLYLSQFATERQRATTFAMPMLAIPLSVIIGGPVSGWLLGQQNMPLNGWRWMFLAEALPTLLLGLCALFYFPDRPADARWLSAPEKAWLASHAAHPVGMGRVNDWRSLRRPLVWLSGLLWFCLLSGTYGLIFWLPQVIGALTSLTSLQIGFVAALPWVGVAVGMYGNAWHSDHTSERYWHVAAPAALSAIAILAGWVAGPGAFAVFALLAAGLGLGAAIGAFWALPTTLLSPAALLVSLVAINIAGSAAGLVMPLLLGVVRLRTGDYAAPTFLIVGVLTGAAVLVGLIHSVHRQARPERRP